MLSLELIRSALESAPDAIIISDEAGVIVFANHRVCALFGYPSDQDLTGWEVERLLPERFRTRHVLHREAFAGTPRARPMGAGLDLYARRRDGSEFPVEISLSPVRDGGRLLVVAAICDVTARKRIEVELIAARETATRANFAKSRFLATASHDLRQPLQALSLLSGTLRRIVTSPVATGILVQQEQALNSMSRLVNALLDISKLESGAVTPEVVDFPLAAILDELRQEFTGVARAKGLALEIETCADSVRSDPALVEQVLRNLVSNAIKYTRQGRVGVHCRAESGAVRIEIVDTGVGIPRRQLPYIFDEFYQVGVPHNAARDGYGLGLSIVKRIVQLLDLRLDVHSEPDQGSRFSLALPAGAERLAAAAAGPAAQLHSLRQAAVPRVLLIEDDQAVREATSLLLRAENCEVIVAASGQEAQQRIADRTDIDLVISDYHLGESETGLDVIAALRARIRADLGAIVLSGDTSSTFKELRADPYLRVASKPIRADQLLGLMADLLVPGR